MGSGNETTDQIIGATVFGNVTVKNFETAAADDAFDISTTGIESRGTGDGTDAHLDLDGGAIGTDAIVLQTTTAASNLDVDGGNGNILVLGGDHATSALVEQALEDGGTHEITLGEDSMLSDGSTNWVIAWDDGTNSYIGVGALETDSQDDTTGGSIDTSTIANIEVTTIVTLEGVSDVTDLVAANFGTNFIA